MKPQLPPHQAELILKSIRIFTEGEFLTEDEENEISLLMETSEIFRDAYKSNEELQRLIYEHFRPFGNSSTEIPTFRNNSD